METYRITKLFDIDKFYLMRKEIPIITKPIKDIRSVLTSKFGKNKLDDINIFLNMLSNPEQALVGKANYPELWNEYVKIAYKKIPYTEGRKYRNNKIIDMSWEVLTHEDTADKILNPGGFEEQKREGYLAEACRIKNCKVSELENLSTKELKNICSTNKNLSFIGTHTQFYKLNAAASSILAIFAVAKVAHACLESNGFRADIKEICNVNYPINIMGLELSGRVEIDPQKDIEGNFIGKTLGSLVASAADAVKDPVLNLMNINSDTVNILNTLIRLGLPFRKAARLLSTKIVSDLLFEYNTSKLKSRKVTSFNNTLSKMVDTLLKKYNLLKQDVLMQESLNTEEVEQALISNNGKTDLKILLALLRISDINYAMSGLNFATRFNSISSAVGPLIIDNLKSENTLNNFPKGIYDNLNNPVSKDEVLDKHPILKAFSKTLYLAEELIGKHSPLYKAQFKAVLEALKDTSLLNTLLKDRKLFSKFSDFYQSMLIAEGLVVECDAATINYYVKKFAVDFIKKDYKNKYINNPFIEAIRFDTNKDGTTTLNINVTGLDAETKSELTSGWLDLYKKDEEGKKLALDLFKYCFFRGGIGFSPQTFMHLFPVQLRAILPNYKLVFEDTPIIEDDYMKAGFKIITEFIKHNWLDGRLVPYRKLIDAKMHDGGYIDFYGDMMEKFKNTFAFYTVTRDDKLRIFVKHEYNPTLGKVIYKQVLPLGNNGEFLDFSYSIHKNTLNRDTENSTNQNDVENNNNIMHDVELPIKKFTFVDAKEFGNELFNKYFSKSLLLRLKKTADELKKLNTNDPKGVLESMKLMITTHLQQKGIEVNKEEVENIAKTIC